ncbi:hypothetical protein SARC_08886 [Sphaeroforma arctica JP610]|uniref:Ribosomal protein L19 n=1 Tax=Sphaeroforma arctica JP610 TaxID=667725 RepID=A0A0L0FPG5_9EUKA|nr:hypothetical protein SARC_08886 [Sphaeroforma arctica JP610]KNC78697.1 hypothetical protein SARC_08886 [Sphaeroforma arctica JP610]|eukprot:XP_014152599.1 hypothetical protein SARC_08886 [Sphaeroforma arctica JP610]
MLLAQLTRVSRTVGISRCAQAGALQHSRTYATADKAEEKEEKIPQLTKLMRGYTKAPRMAKKKGQENNKKTLVRSQPYRAIPDDAQPRDFHTNLMGLLNMREVARHRKRIDIPVHTAGCIMQVVALDNANTKRAKPFIGICTARPNRGTASSLTLRNVVDGVLLEKSYMVYSPLIKEIKVLEFQRARRAKMYYLDDHPLNMSTINSRRFKEVNTTTTKDAKKKGGKGSKK